MLYPIQNDVRNRLDLSGIWDFKTDPEGVGDQQGWFNGLGETRPIAVPGSWNERVPPAGSSLTLQTWNRPAGSLFPFQKERMAT